jgi:hypothetical protein
VGESQLGCGRVILTDEDFDEAWRIANYVMRRSKFEAPGFQMELDKYGHLTIWAQFADVDNDGEMKRYEWVDHDYVAGFDEMTQDECRERCKARIVYQAVVNMAHEMCEYFTYSGKRIFDPHNPGRTPSVKMQFNDYTFEDFVG